jgi:hypothetical protein
MSVKLPIEEKFSFRFEQNQAPFETVGQVLDYIQKVKA